EQEALARAVAERDFALIRERLGALDELVDRHLGGARKSTAREYAESIGVAILIALFLRSFVVEAFKIPSASMVPTLKVGDHIFVNKFIYGLGRPLSGVKFWIYGKPQRGDVIVFKSPEDPENKDFIKRVVAVEGDTVEIRQTLVYVNGQQVPRQHIGVMTYTDISDEALPHRVETYKVDEYRETLDGRQFSIYLKLGYHTSGCQLGARYACSGPLRVPPGKVFVMGDNRDNSSDSRYWGFVPAEYIKGKAMFIWYSGDPTRDLFTGLRLERFGHLVR